MAENTASTIRPTYVSLDLGLRQRRRHYHGGVIFQCVGLPDRFFRQILAEENNDVLVSLSGRGMKIAEGGDYTDYVRKNRPPGNFATTFLNYYTTAPIPTCVGVRFSVGSIVEHLYKEACSADATVAVEALNVGEMSQGSRRDMELLRRSFGHPLGCGSTVQCIVCSVHGMDTASIPERFLVASRLWANGVSAEYLPQSGVILNLLRSLREEPQESGGSSDWSLTELQGVCAILQIPYLVVVQPHLLEDKGSVRLRRVVLDAIPNQSGYQEAFVSLDNLASTIQGETGKSEDELFGEEIDVSAQVDSRPSKADIQVETIYIDNDQYFGGDRELSKNTASNWKAYMKVMKGVTMSAVAYLSSMADTSKEAVSHGMQGLPVFAVSDVSFFVLRDFGTTLMRREGKEQGSHGRLRGNDRAVSEAQTSSQDTIIRH